MSISVADISSSIWVNQLGQSNLTTVPEIAFWVRNHGVGALNSLIFTSFSIDSTTQEISPDITIDEQSILSQLYLIKFFQTQANSFLGAAGVKDTIEYSEKGHTIRKLNKNEISKTFISLKNQAREDLNQLIGFYKIKKASPRDVSGYDQTVQVFDYPRFNRVLYTV